jgi:hypothetical protein
VIEREREREREREKDQSRGSKCLPFIPALVASEEIKVLDAAAAAIM